MFCGRNHISDKKDKLTKIIETIPSNKNNLVAAECKISLPTNTIFIISASKPYRADFLKGHAHGHAMDIYSFSFFTSCSYLPLRDLLQTCFQSKRLRCKSRILILCQNIADIAETNMRLQQIEFDTLSDYLPVLLKHRFLYTKDQNFG